MTVVALCSGKGSPGVTTLACVAGAVWPSRRRIVVAECDPSGNDLAVRFGLSARIGMTSLVLASRRTKESHGQVDAHVQRLPGGLEALAGPANAEAATSLDRELVAMGTAIFPLGLDVLVDCGRILTGARGQQEILKASDHVVVIVRPDAAGIAHALGALELVRGLDPKGATSFAAVGPSPFQAREIEQALQMRMLGMIPVDHQAAAMVCGAPGRPKAFARSRLVESVQRLVERILDQPGMGHREMGGTESVRDVPVTASNDRLPTAPMFELPVPGGNGAEAG